MEIRDKLLQAFPQLEPDDIKSTTMGESGEDLQLSPAARKLIPLTIEVKRRKNDLVTVYKWLDQSKLHIKGSAQPVVFYRGDRREWIAILPLDDYINLLKGKTDE